MTPGPQNTGRASTAEPHVPSAATSATGVTPTTGNTLPKASTKRSCPSCRGGGGGQRVRPREFLPAHAPQTRVGSQARHLLAPPGRRPAHRHVFTRRPVRAGPHARQGEAPRQPAADRPGSQTLKGAGSPDPNQPPCQRLPCKLLRCRQTRCAGPRNWPTSSPGSATTHASLCSERRC